MIAPAGFVALVIAYFENCPKAHAIICWAERGKPYVFLCRNAEVSTPQEEEMTQRVEERDKKRMPSCNGADRGSNFAPA